MEELPEWKLKEVLGISRVVYTRRYVFEEHSPNPRQVRTREVEIVDPRVRLSVETKDLLKSFYLNPLANVVFSIPLAYNRLKGTYDLIEEPNKVEADTKFFFYPSEPAPESDAGLYYPRVDKYYRVLTHVAQIDKQVKIEYITGSNTALAASASWDTGPVDSTKYSQIRGFVSADQSGILNYYVSYDGTNWTNIYSETISANQGTGFELDTMAKYVKVEYVNGSTAQGSFEIRVYGVI